MDFMLLLLIIVVALALIFDFINGFHDSANAIATTVATKALSPGVAVIYAAVLNLAGALAGTEVAATIGKGLVEISSIGLVTILCTLISAILWNLLTWWKGLPSSSSHALIGSLLGASFASGLNSNAIHWSAVLNKVVMPMISSPFIGLLIGFILMKMVLKLVAGLKVPENHSIFSRLQIFSAGFMAFEHGRNDAQKSMGVIALALLLAFPQTGFEIPLWVKLACAISMGMGTWTGGWRIIKTMGYRITKLEPIHGFTAEITAASIISFASHSGFPVSTTQIISSAVLGVGSAKTPPSVRWKVFGRIVGAWVLTLPLTFVFAGLMMLILQHLF